MDHELLEGGLGEPRAKWLSRLADEFQKLGPLVPIKLPPEEEEWPPWVRRVAGEFGAAVLPHARVKDGGMLDARRMGALLGHHCAMAVWTMEWIHQRWVVEKKDMLKKLPREAKEKWEGFVLWMVGRWFPSLRRLAKLALCSSVDQSYVDMTDFLRGFSKAFACKPKSLAVGDLGNLTFEIYVFMLMKWRLVGSLGSVTELHRLLVQHIGPQRVGELKRIQRICERIGLQYRKAGCPKRTGIIPTR